MTIDMRLKKEGRIVKPVDPELREVLDSAESLPIPERVRRLRDTAAWIRTQFVGQVTAEQQAEVDAEADNIEWAAEELSTRGGYAALAMLADICSEIAEAPGRVEHFELKIDPIRESPRFKRLELVVRMDGPSEAEGR